MYVMHHESRRGGGGGGEGGHSPVLASTGLCCRSFCGHES